MNDRLKQNLIPLEIEPLSLERITQALQKPAFNAAEICASLREVFQMADPGNSDHLHQLLDIILELRGIARSNGNGDEAGLAREAAAILINGALGWTRRTKPVYAESIEALEAEPRRWRQEVSEQLKQGTDLLPDWLANPLIGALGALGDGSGDTPPLLEPTARHGHGVNPKYAEFLERILVCWVFYEAGRGSTIVNARERVAEMAGVSTKTVEKWQTDWRRADPTTLDLRQQLYRDRGAGGLPFGNDSQSLQEAAREWRLARLPAKAIGRRTPTKRPK